MIKIRRFSALFLSTFLCITALTGCVSSSDKNAAKETANNFLSIIASGSSENINQYCTDEVAESDFVKLFDSKYLSDQILADQDTSLLTEETLNELDEFCELFSKMVTDYEVKEIDVADDGSLSAIATITTNFPVDIIQKTKSSQKVLKAAEEYSTEHEEEINALYIEEGEEATQSKIFNDIFLLALTTYEEEINASSPQDYAIVLSLEKNEETDSYIVTDVTDYVTAAEGATAAAEETSVN